jgi:hypothetical protein
MLNWWKNFLNVWSLNMHHRAYNRIKVKVKGTLVQALKLCTGRMACRGSRGIVLLIHDHGTRKWWGVSVTPRALFTPRKDSVPIIEEAEWAPGPVWTGGKPRLTGIRSLDRPARSSVAIPTTLPGQRLISKRYQNLRLYRILVRWNEEFEGIFKRVTVP